VLLLIKKTLQALNINSIKTLKMEEAIAILVDKGLGEDKI